MKKLICMLAFALVLITSVSAAGVSEGTSTEETPVLRILMSSGDAGPGNIKKALDTTAAIMGVELEYDVIPDLTDDYLDVTGNYSSHFPHVEPPLAREAPCFFKNDPYYYIISSGTTGYNPNPTEVASSSLMHGPYNVHGMFCEND